MADVDLTSYDGALLAFLEKEGSIPRGSFISAAADLRPLPESATPEDERTVAAWLADAEERGLVRVDSDDDLISISSNGRDRLVELL